MLKDAAMDLKALASKVSENSWVVKRSGRIVPDESVGRAH